MTREEFDTLCRDDVRRAVEENLGRDPLAVALDRRTPHAALVATQVKYLERARTKLPSYYAARCILPPRAFEQASSEACAAHKEPAGDAALDLTCGLGVDALALGRRFRPAEDFFLLHAGHIFGKGRIQLCGGLVQFRPDFLSALPTKS